MCTAHARVAPPRRALRRSRGACLSRQPWRASWDLFQPSAPRAGQLLLTPDLVSMAAISGEIFVLWSVVGSVGKSHLVTQCADVHHAMRPMHCAQSTAPNLQSECAQCNTPNAPNATHPMNQMQGAHNALRPMLCNALCNAMRPMQCAMQCAQCYALRDNAPNAMRYAMRPTQCAQLTAPIMQCAMQCATVCCCR